MENLLLINNFKYNIMANPKCREIFTIYGGNQFIIQEFSIFEIVD